MKEYKWLQVKREAMGSSKYNSARYKRSVITLFDYFYTYSPNKQKAVLEHEFAHHVWHTMPRAVKIFWVGISKTIWIYVNSYAKKNHKEDLSECVEALSLIRDGELEQPTWMLALKIEIANKLYEKYSKTEIAKLLTNKYNGKSIDFDGVYWHQCVDLVKQYSSEFLLTPLGTFWGSAKTGWENKSNTFPEDKWEKIRYTGRNKPKVGDIVFYDNEPYGHVWICIGSNWVIFEQNMGNWDGEWSDDYCRIEIMKKTNLAGWYRLRG